jgi:hypothetical protein
MFVDPVSLSLLAGGASLIAGIAKSLKTWATRKNEENMLTLEVQLGGEKLDVTRLLDQNQIRALIDRINVEAAKPTTAKPSDTKQ